MKRDPGDRVVDHALRALAGQHEALERVDLAERIAAAWARGERGSGWEEEEREQRCAGSAGPELAAPEPAAARGSAAPRRPVLLAAAVLAAAGGALLGWLAGPERTPAAGPGREVAALELRGDGALRVAGPALVRLRLGEEGPRVELALASPEVVDGEEAGIRAGTTEIRLAAGALVAVFLEEDGGGSWPRDRGARALPGALLPTERWARVELEAGRAVLAGPGGPAALEPGVAWLIAPRGGASGPVPRAAEERLAETLGRLLHPPGSPLPTVPRWTPTRDDRPALSASLDELLADRPQLWPLYARELRAAFRELGPGERGRARALDDLVERAGDEALELARELWLVEPEAFAPRHVVALAGRGLPEFEREPAAMLAFRETDDLADLHLPAAWLALRGEPEGLAQLRELAPQPARDSAALARKLLASSVLARLGFPDAWRTARETAVADARAALEREEPTTRGTWTALALAFFDPRGGAFGEGPLVTSATRLDQFLTERFDALLEPALALEHLGAR